jgi:hypothetical protein
MLTLLPNSMAFVRRAALEGEVVVDQMLSPGFTWPPFPFATTVSISEFGSRECAGARRTLPQAIQSCESAER